MDRVFIKDISLFGKHGVHEEERLNEQEFRIDILAKFDASQSVKSDDLADTVNYVDFLAIAKEAVEQNSFYLIERLGSRIAERILDDTRIASVEVTVHKPAALTNGKPGITIVRSRP